MNQISHRQFDAMPTTHTFRSVALDYMKHRGHNRYLLKIIDYFGDRPISDIHPFDIREMATSLYPDQANSTRNRCAITPARSVFLHGYDRGWCGLIRLRNFKAEKPILRPPASQLWLHLFVRQCEADRLPHLAACVIFMSQTGARVSEAVSLLWKDIDLPSRRVVLVKTKTGTNSERFLTDDMVNRLYRLQDGSQPNDHAFRYKSRWSVNDRILAVCRRAGIEYKPSHTCGRKAMATNAIGLGIDIRTVMEAGDWKSANLFMNTYVRVKHAGRRVADRFNSYSYDNDL